MQTLQQKAHTSIAEFKAGRSSPLASLSLPGSGSGPSSIKQLLTDSAGQLHSPDSHHSPGTPSGSSEDALAGEDDELAKLGGRTRLIKDNARDKNVVVKENSASPTLSPLRGFTAFGTFPSPSGQNASLNGSAVGAGMNGAGVAFGAQNIGQPQHHQGAVVPLPLTLHDGAGAAAVHPSVVDYLSSFGYAGQQARHASEQMAPGYGHGAGGAYTSTGGSATSTGTLPTPTSPDSGLVLPSPVSGHSHHYAHHHSQSQSQSHVGGQHLHPSQHQHQHQTQGQHPYVPQYFPVFDYSAAPGAGYSGAGGGASAAYDQDTTMAYEPEPLASHSHHGHNGHGGHGMNGAGGLPPYARREITPEGGGASMHNTWMDFVNQMSTMQ